MNAACLSVTSLDGSMRDRAHKRVCVVLFYHCVASFAAWCCNIPSDLPGGHCRCFILFFLSSAGFRAFFN